jgi:hypothetical protein
MCPVCLTTALLIAGSVASTGGLAAIAIKTFGVKKAVDNHPASTQSRLSRTKNSTAEVFLNADERRNQNVN